MDELTRRASNRHEADEHQRRARWAWLVGMLLVGLPPILLAPVWRLWGLSALEDGLLYYLPQRVWLARTILAGDSPLWQPLIYGGFPAFADPQVALTYPPTYLFVFLPAWLAYPMTICLHHTLAGWFTYRLCRWLDRSRTGSLLAAVAFMFCGFLLSHREHLTMHHAAAWTPGVIWMWLRFARSGSLRDWALGVAVVSLQLLAGHVQVVLMTAPIVVAAVLFVAWRDRYRWWACLGGFASAGLVCAVQILPALQLMRLSAERGDIVHATWNSLLWRSLALPLFPMLYGQRTPNAYPVAWCLRESHQCEQTIYVGLITLMLAVVAIGALWRRERWVRFWTVVGVLALAVALGKNLGVWFLVSWLPIYSALHTPARWVLIVHLALVVLAAMGVDALLARRDELRRKADACVRRLPKILLVPVVLIAGYVLVGRAMGPVRAAGLTNPALWVPVVLGIVAWCLLRTASSHRGRWVSPALLVLVIADMATVAPFLDVSTRPVTAITESAAADVLLGSGFDRNKHRVWVIPGDAFDSPRACLMPDTNLLDGIATLNGYGPMLPKEMEALMAFRPWAITDEAGWWLTRPAVLARFGVSHVVLRDPNVVVEGLDRHWDFLGEPVKGLTVYRNRHAARPAYCASSYRWFPDEQALIGRLRSTVPAGSLHRQVYLTGPSRPTIEPGEGHVLSSRITNGEARFEVFSAGGTLLVWLNRGYPGWRADIDGVPVKIHTADVMGQAVFVPSGRHVVTFRFRPRVLAWSGVLSVLAGLTVVLFLLRHKGLGSDRRRVGPTASTPEPQP